MSQEIHLASLEPHLRPHETNLDALNQRLQALEDRLGQLRTGKPRRRASEAKQTEMSEAPAKTEPTLAELEAQHALTKRAVAAHERLLAMARDERIVAVLAEVAADRQLAREAAVDPRAFAAARGIELPERMALEMQVSDSGATLRITHYDDDVPFVLIWTDDGFMPPPTRESDEPKSAGPAS